MLDLHAFSVFLRALIVAAAHAVSPPTCASCDALVSSSDAVFCPACARTVVRSRSPGGAGAEDAARLRGGAAHIVAYGSFDGALADAIRRFKYSDRPDLARPLGQLLCRAAGDAGLRAGLVVPVPLHPRRLAERGYNQAALLAARVASGLAAPLAARALVRLRNTAQQARLARDARLGNMAGAFHVRAPDRVRGRAVVLVDDVATTGATLEACIEALIAAGAASVACLVVACADRGKVAARSAA